MNASYMWLRDFVDFDLSPPALRDLLTERVATVEEIVSLRDDLAGILIGRVIEAARHPDSDHLWVTKVDAGGDALRDVVCGAPNVVAGRLYPFAPVGTVLPGGLKLEKRKIRGALSEGMLCSARELRLGTDHEGILALDVDAAPGTRFLDAVPVGDTMLVVDVLPNRPDLLSHLGIAREIAAATGTSVRWPTLPVASHVDHSQPTQLAETTAATRIDDTEGCSRYMGAHITGVTVGPSPEWLVARVEAVGARSINNIVDVTNYMLHGFGQPMHAFDLAHIHGAGIIVRRGLSGERLTTLDGVDRLLDENMTIIADSERAQAVAGVIGGQGSEVTDATRDVFLEVAAFDPARIRATRRRLGVSTDASYRFERGVDASAIPGLVDYAVTLIISVAGGRLASAITDKGKPPPHDRQVSLRTSRVAQVLGIAIRAQDIARHLSSIGFVAAGNDELLLVTVPSYRADVTSEVDLIEEVARLHGYSEFPSELRPFRIGTVPTAPAYATADAIRGAAGAAGLYEVRPMPFVKHGDDRLRVRNPLADDEAFLRTTILDSLVARAEFNLARMQRNVRIYEIGTVFSPRPDVTALPPVERLHVGAIIMGERRPPHFTEARPPIIDEWDAKALASRLAIAAYPGCRIETTAASGGDDGLWTVSVNGHHAGHIRSLVMDAPVWAADAYGVELNLQIEHTPATAGGVYFTGRQPGKCFVPIPAMPAMQVDLALIVPDHVAAGEVDALIRREAGELLETLTVFDEFHGAGIPAGSRGLGWALTFRHRERTLRDKEIQGRTAKILTSLEAALGVRQRTA